jgi:hypothetical protein
MARSANLSCHFPFLQCYSINTIKDELLVTFVPLKIIMYPAILNIYLFRFEISDKVQCVTRPILYKF